MRAEWETVMSVLGVIQARMSSSRMPGKVLQPILDKPMLQHQIERVLRAKSIDRLVIATSSDTSDDEIATLCSGVMFQIRNVGCYRGVLKNVLSRFAGLANTYGGRHLVRLTGDCPLVDPDIIDEIVALHLDSGADYTSNVEHPTLPDGYDVEVVRQSALFEAAERAVMPSEREHVTPYIRSRPDHFRIEDYQYKMSEHGVGEQTRDWSAYRLTVDYPEDFELVKRIFEHLYPSQPQFGVKEVIALLDAHPDWLQLNQHIDRNEGYQQSLLQDKEFLRTLKRDAQNQFIHKEF